MMCPTYIHMCVEKRYIRVEKRQGGGVGARVEGRLRVGDSQEGWCRCRWEEGGRLGQQLQGDAIPPMPYARDLAECC